MVKAKNPHPGRKVFRHKAPRLHPEHRRNIKGRTGADPLLVDALVYSGWRQTWTA